MLRGRGGSGNWVRGGSEELAAGWCRGCRTIGILTRLRAVRVAIEAAEASRSRIAASSRLSVMRRWARRYPPAVGNPPGSGCWGLRGNVTRDELSSR